MTSDENPIFINRTKPDNMIPAMLVYTHITI